MRLAFLCLVFCASLIPLEAADNSRTLEAISKIDSYLDEKQASSFYLDSKNIGTFKDEFLKDTGLTKDGRFGISRQLIQNLIRSGKDKEALEVCKDFSEKYPGSETEAIKLYYLAGESFQELQKYDRAIESYQQALSYPGKAGFMNYIHISLGWCYYAKTRYGEAIEEYGLALKEGHLNSDGIQWAWFETGRCHFFLKNYEDAAAAFKQVMKINPDTKLARQAKINIEDIEKLKNGGAS
jgi:tetratricopeptide (TPR) repeat protein